MHTHWYTYSYLSIFNSKWKDMNIFALATLNRISVAKFRISHIYSHIEKAGQRILGIHPLGRTR